MTISYLCHDAKRRGGGDPRLSIIMMLIEKKKVWRCPLTLRLSPNSPKGVITCIWLIRLAVFCEYHKQLIQANATFVDCYLWYSMVQVQYTQYTLKLIIQIKCHTIAIKGCSCSHTAHVDCLISSNVYLWTKIKEHRELADMFPLWLSDKISECVWKENCQI